jgi:hypothetical protein
MPTPTTSDQESELAQYLASLSPKELQGYHIAKSHLGMTYQYEKTNGFMEWKKKQADQTKLA